MIDKLFCNFKTGSLRIKAYPTNKQILQLSVKGNII